MMMMMMTMMMMMMNPTQSVDGSNPRPSLISMTTRTRPLVKCVDNVMVKADNLKNAARLSAICPSWKA